MILKLKVSYIEFINRKDISEVQNYIQTKDSVILIMVVWEGIIGQLFTLTINCPVTLIQLEVISTIFYFTNHQNQH